MYALQLIVVELPCRYASRERSLEAMTEVLGTDEFTVWFGSLNEQDMDAVAYSVDLLEQLGLSLRFPHTSALKGTSYALRELRVQSGGHPIRIIYAFDPKRRAVLLIGGDKTGDDRFYGDIIPRAEVIWEAYLEETKDDLCPPRGNGQGVNPGWKDKDHGASPLERDQKGIDDPGEDPGDRRQGPAGCPGDELAGAS
jgi:hypothetical protein